MPLHSQPSRETLWLCTVSLSYVILRRLVDEAKAHIMAAWDWAENCNIFSSHQEGVPSRVTKKLMFIQPEMEGSFVCKVREEMAFY